MADFRKLNVHNPFRRHVINANARFRIGTTGFRIAQALQDGILRLQIILPTELRHVRLVQPYKRQLLRIRTPSEQRRGGKLLLVQPVRHTVDDLRVLVLRHRHFGAKIELVDIEVIAFRKSHIPSVRAHHRVAHLDLFALEHPFSQALTGVPHCVIYKPFRYLRMAENLLLVLALQPIPRTSI